MTTRYDTQSNEDVPGLNEEPEMEPVVDVGSPTLSFVYAVCRSVISVRKSPGTRPFKLSRKTITTFFLSLTTWLVMAGAIAWREQKLSVPGLVESGAEASACMFGLGCLLLIISLKMRSRHEAVEGSRQFGRGLLAVGFLFGIFSVGLMLFVIGILMS